MKCSVRLACLFVLVVAGRTQSPVSEQDFRANHQLGEFYIKQQKYAEALPYLEKAYALNGSDYANAFDLATLYLQVKSPEKSRAVIEGLLKTGEKAELHNLLGDVEDAEGHVDEAAREFERAARLDGSEKNYFDLGSYLANHRAYEPALKVFEYAVKQYGRSARLRVGLGVADYSLGHYDDAVEALCQAVDLDPADSRPIDFLGKMYDISPRYTDAASARLRHFVAQNPRVPEANFYYALSLRKRTMGGQQTALREKYLLRAVELKPIYPEAHFELGLMYEDERLTAKAMSQYETAVKQKPDFEKAHYRLAQLYERLGKKDAARREFAEVKRLKEANRR